MRKLLPILIAFAFTLVSFSQGPIIAFKTLNKGGRAWHSASVVIDHTQVGSNLTDFPVVVKGTATQLKTTSNGGYVTSSSGYDIAFFSDAALTTPLKFEKESWNGSTGDYVYWVKIPTVSSSVNTTFYLAYGNSAVTTDQSDAVNVWNSAYKGVWHMTSLSGGLMPVTDSRFRSTSQTATAISATASAWDNSIRGESGNIIYDPGNAIGGNYLMFFTGYAGSYTEGQTYLGIAYSSDGVSWTKYASNPIALPSNVYIEDPYCIKVGSTYYLYGEDAPNVHVKLYTSTDLTNWTAQGTVLSGTAAQWDASWVGSPNVWKEGSTWYMLYEGSGGGGEMGLATSSDGISWTKDAGNPVFAASGTTWASGALSPDDLYKSGSTYYLLYHAQVGSVFETGLATSTNLTTWTDNSHSPINNSVTTMFLDQSGHFIESGASGASETNVYLSSGISSDLPDATTVNDAVNHGSSSTTGIIGNAQNFNGSSNYLDCGSNSSLNITSNGTWSCWVNMNAQPGNGVWFRIFDKSGSGTLGILAGYATVSSVASVGMFYADASQSWISQTLTTGTWYHVAYVHDDTNNQDIIYVNGSAINTAGSRTSNPGTQSTAFFLMAENPAAKYVNGILDETHISNVARNADWINAEWGNQKSSSTFLTITF